MAELATIAAIASIGASVVGTGISVAGSLEAGRQEQETQNLLAKQEEARGRGEFAASQREARERRLEAELIMSRQQAVAAASGGGAGEDAPTIERLMTETAKRARLGEESVLFAGRERKRALFESAAARRKSGQQSFLGSIFTAGGSLASGIGRVGNTISANPGAFA